VSMNTRTYSNTPSPTCDVRTRILTAAGERFAQFGYNKTTMAEIAKDCDMSAANLYRFFKNKLDIGSNLACACLDTKLLLVKDVVQQTQQPAAERLHNVVLQILSHTHNEWANNPRINEMVTAICDARLEIVNQYELNRHNLIVELLEDGVRRDEFSIPDVQDTAEAITTAITLFSVPLFMSLHNLETFEKRAKSVVQLMLSGLEKR